MSIAGIAQIYCLEIPKSIFFMNTIFMSFTYLLIRSVKVISSVAALK